MVLLWSIVRAIGVTFCVQLAFFRKLAGQRMYFVYTDCTDKGSDQSARKRRLSAALANNPNILYVPGDCMMHAFHSAIKDGFQLLDNIIPLVFDAKTLGGFCKYYSSMAKLVHVWRERASEVMTAWDQYHGSRNDISQEELHQLLEFGRRYPHQIVSGRWGSVEEAEQFLQERGRKNIVPVMQRVLAKNMKASKASILPVCRSLLSW